DTLAFDKENNLMLTYYSSDSKIVKFSPDGKQISDNTTDKFPYSISIDSDNNVFIGINYYLSDYNYLSKIIKYDQNGKKIYEWGEYGTEDDKLNVIGKIRFGKDGNLYILDRKNKIGIFSKDGVFIKAFGDFNFPTGIAFDIAGNIYVSDNSDKIYIFNDKHEILNTINMNDRFSVAYISDIIIKNDLLFVSDYYNQKLLIFNLNNNSIVFKKNIILNKGHYAGTLALNNNNDLYFIDEATNGFYIYDFVSD
ncbi:MAG TPA: NHL repeat-containing protein, partial [Spirochaetota bacterium]|nr:NHL repeat-containing protein [Spirochaetota bacterium]